MNYRDSLKKIAADTLDTAVLSGIARPELKDSGMATELGGNLAEIYDDLHSLVSAHSPVPVDDTILSTYRNHFMNYLEHYYRDWSGVPYLVMCNATNNPPELRGDRNIRVEVRASIKEDDQVNYMEYVLSRNRKSSRILFHELFLKTQNITRN